MGNHKPYRIRQNLPKETMQFPGGYGMMGMLSAHANLPFPLTHFPARAIIDIIQFTMRYGLELRVIRSERFDAMQDEELVALSQRGDEDALEYLLGRYKNFVRSKARSYFLIGADREDIVQEGMIALYKAIRDFDPNKPASFHAFAELCITRHIISAIKAATRQKHIPLNSYVSLNKSIFDEDSDRTLLDVLPPESELDPQELFINEEDRMAI